MYYLDTNTCIYFLNGRFEEIRRKILTTPPSEITIPALVKAELILGAYKSTRRDETLEKVEKFSEPFEIASFEDQMAYTYAEIRHKCEMSGQIVGPNDLIIASIVKFHEGILVTNNIKEFKRIEELKLENWTQPDFA
jgi:tRNA(fMet)-specific endonuclease VapC